MQKEYRITGTLFLFVNSFQYTIESPKNCYTEKPKILRCKLLIVNYSKNPIHFSFFRANTIIGDKYGFGMARKYE